MRKPGKGFGIGGLISFVLLLVKALDTFIAWRDRVQTGKQAVDAIRAVEPLGTGFWALLVLAVAGLAVFVLAFWDSIGASLRLLPGVGRRATRPLYPLPDPGPAPRHLLPGPTAGTNLGLYRGVIDTEIRLGEVFVRESVVTSARPVTKLSFESWFVRVRQAFRRYLTAASRDAADSGLNDAVFVEEIRVVQGEPAYHEAVGRGLVWLKRHRAAASEGDMRLTTANPTDAPEAETPPAPDRVDETIAWMRTESALFCGKPMTLLGIIHALRREFEKGVTEHQWGDLVKMPVPSSEKQIAMMEAKGPWAEEHYARERKPGELLLDLCSHKVIRLSEDGRVHHAHGRTYLMDDRGREVVRRIERDPSLLSLTQA